MSFRKSSPDKVTTYYSWKRSRISAIVWALILGIYTFSKVYGYAKGYPSLSSRVQFADLMSKSSGVNILIGPNYQLQTMAGYTVWATFMVLLICGAIWGILVVSKQLRGDEETGYYESLLSGEVSLTGLTKSVIKGTFLSVVTFFILITVIVSAMARTSIINLPIPSTIYFCLSIAVGVWLFMLLSAVCSQLMPTRSRANILTLSIFSVFFILKAIADTTSAKWLLNLSPLGWFEKLRPYEGSNYHWFLPIFLLIGLLLGTTIYLVSKRELNSSWLSSPGSYKPKLALLSSPQLFVIRINRNLVLIWLFLLSALTLFYGLLTKAATQALNSSPKYLQALHKFDPSNNNFAAKSYVGAIYFLSFLLLSIYIANCLSTIRKNETESYDLSILTGPVDRIKYLSSKIFVFVSGLVIISLGLSLAFWLGTNISGLNVISLSNFMLAGLNAVVPALMVFGVGIFLFGFIPRYSTIIIYCLIIWSLLVSLLTSDLKISHYVNDLSFFSHVKFAPTVSADWKTNLFLILGSLVFGLIGILLYNKRDLISD